MSGSLDKTARQEMREHQRTIRENILAAEARHDWRTAEILTKTYRPLLEIVLPPEPDPKRIPGSPINTIEL